jgi:hypothetical protein
VQALSIAPQQDLHNEPLSHEEFSAMVTAMCGRYGVLRQAIEEMAESEIRELRQQMKATRG